MTEDRKTEEQAIEELLGTRQQLTEWLQKIGAAGEGVPGSVRERVRADYEGRLAEVVFALRSHSETLTATVDTLRSALEEQDRIRIQEEEAIAEVELRFHVGEFSEAEWTSRNEVSKGKLEEAVGAINRLTADITRLEEVLGQVHEEPATDAATTPVESSAPADAPVRVTDEAREGTPEAARNGGMPGATPGGESDAPILHREEAVHQAAPSAPVEAPRFIPKGTESASASRPVRVGAGTSPRGSAGAPGDDLAFLKAMTIDPSRSTAAPRAGERAERAGSATGGKSLKCGECSAMNRPTEWYCERCGAELAAL